MVAITGCLAVILLVMSHRVDGVKYHMTWTPNRFQEFEDVTINFSLENFTQPLGKVQLQNTKRGSLFEAGDEGCNHNETTRQYFNTSVVFCDNEHAKFAVKIQDYTVLLSYSYSTFRISAEGQSPTQSRYYQIKYYSPPDNVQVVIISTFNHDRKLLSCGFRGGSDHYAYFTWSRVNTSRPLPADARMSVSAPPGMGAHYGYNSYLSWIGGPGDEGLYQCTARYDPIIVGVFTSEPLYVDVRYRPQLDTSRPYHNYLEATPGDDVEFTADLVANPEPRFVWWQKDGKNLTNDDRFSETENAANVNYTLSFTVRVGDYGIYQCIAENELGNGRIFFKLAPPADNFWKLATICLIVLIVIIVLGLVILIVVVLVCRCRNHASRQPTVAKTPALAPSVEKPDDGGLTNVGYVPEPKPAPKNDKPTKQTKPALPDRPADVDEIDADEIYMNDIEFSGPAFARATLQLNRDNVGEPEEDEAGYMAMTRPLPARR